MRIVLLVLIAMSGWVGLRQFNASQRAEMEEAVAAANTEVVVYVTSWCELCDEAREHLDARGVDYLTRDIETSPEAYASYRARGGSGAVPMIVIGGETLRGSDPGTVDAHLLALDS